jgi:hypothetical protein
MTEAEWMTCEDPKRMLGALDSNKWKAALEAFPRACVSSHKLPAAEGQGWSVRVATPTAQAQLLRCLVGNPFRTVAFSSEWRTDTVVLLVRTVSESRDFGAMPILADALQDAGCDSDEILSHCRGPGPHVRGCWVVDLVLGRCRDPVTSCRSGPAPAGRR